MTAEEASAQAARTNGWRVDGDALFKRFEFANFAESLAFVNKVGEIAEAAEFPGGVGEAVAASKPFPAGADRDVPDWSTRVEAMRQVLRRAGLRG